MAEGLLSKLGKGRFVAESAGCSRSGYVHPMAIEVMSEIGLEIGGWRSKSHTEFLDRDVHTVITVCGNAELCCPIFPGQVNRYHWPFDDPAEFTGTEEEVRAEFRRVRDEIKRVMTAYVAGLQEGVPGKTVIPRISGSIVTSNLCASEETKGRGNERDLLGFLGDSRRAAPRGYLLPETRRSGESVVLTCLPKKNHQKS